MSMSGCCSFMRCSLSNSGLLQGRRSWGSLRRCAAVDPPRASRGWEQWAARQRPARLAGTTALHLQPALLRGAAAARACA